MTVLMNKKQEKEGGLMKQYKKVDLWSAITVIFLILFAIFLVYPMFGILRQSVIDAEGNFTFNEFIKFFSQSYYSKTIFNSFKVTIAITIVTLIIAVPLAYFYSFYYICSAKVAPDSCKISGG